MHLDFIQYIEKHIQTPYDRAFAVKVATKRLPASPFSGLLKGCKGHKTHRFENGGTNQVRKTGNREVVLLQPLPQTLYIETPHVTHLAAYHTVEFDPLQPCTPDLASVGLERASPSCG